MPMHKAERREAKEEEEEEGAKNKERGRKRLKVSMKRGQKFANHSSR